MMQLTVPVYQRHQPLLLCTVNCLIWEFLELGIDIEVDFSIFICSVIVLHWSFSGFDTIRLEILWSNKFSSKHAPYLCRTILVYLNVLLVICWILLGRSGQLPDMAIVLGTLDWSQLSLQFHNCFSRKNNTDFCFQDVNDASRHKLRLYFMVREHWSCFKVLQPL